MYIDVTIQFVTKQSICTEAGVWIERSIILPSWLECESTDTIDAGDPRWNSRGHKQWGGWGGFKTRRIILIDCEHVLLRKIKQEVCKFEQANYIYMETVQYPIQHSGCKV